MGLLKKVIMKGSNYKYLFQNFKYKLLPKENKNKFLWVFPAPAKLHTET